LADIANHAKIGKATLHRYFAGRDDLMLALGYRAVDLVAAAIRDSHLEQGPPLEALSRLIEALIPLGSQINFLLSDPLISNHPELSAADRASQKAILALLQRSQAGGELRADLPAEWMLHLLNYGMYATWEALQAGEIARKEATPLLITSLLEGFRHPPP
jgi:AcrR family transcriptional regulator